jgi:nucleotide-binding universal stress UspA family protein
VRKILVPVDGSEESVHAAKWAAELAALSGGQVTLLHVHHTPGSEAMGLMSLEKDEIEESERRIAAPSFDKARAVMGDAVTVESLVSIGDPADEILGLAKSKQFTLIVMGGRARSATREFLLGSVSDKVVRHSPCAVTVVH